MASGWLKKESEHLKMWNDRYVILHGEFLFYSKSEEKCLSRPCGVIHLNNSICTPCPEKHEFGFSISYHNDLYDINTVDCNFEVFVLDFIFEFFIETLNHMVNFFTFLLKFYMVLYSVLEQFLQCQIMLFDNDRLFELLVFMFNYFIF